MTSFAVPSDDVTAKSLENFQTWKLEDAKARFSEVVRLARDTDPQLVTVRGKDAVVVIAADQFANLLPLLKQPNIHELLSQSPLSSLDFEPPGVRSPVRAVEL